MLGFVNLLESRNHLRIFSRKKILLICFLVFVSLWDRERERFWILICELLFWIVWAERVFIWRESELNPLIKLVIGRWLGSGFGFWFNLGEFVVILFALCLSSYASQSVQSLNVRALILPCGLYHIMEADTKWCEHELLDRLRTNMCDFSSS